MQESLFRRLELSARQNLSFFARLYGLDPDAVVPEALEAAALTDRADDEAHVDFVRFIREVASRHSAAIVEALLRGQEL